jgi:hypothetical protein
MLLHAIAAEDRPALEHFLVPCFPSRIVGPEREPWINHHSQVCVVRKADGDAGKVGGGAEHNFLDRQSPNLRELYQSRVGLLRSATGFLWGFFCRLFFQGSALVPLFAIANNQETY